MATQGLESEARLEHGGPPSLDTDVSPDICADHGTACAGIYEGAEGDCANLHPHDHSRIRRVA